MFNFFVDAQARTADSFIITGADCNHIKNVLRMVVGDVLLVSVEGKSHLCIISEINDRGVIAEIEQEDYQSTELPVKIHLFQGLPKSDKMELIIQKCVELGVASITPVEMAYCVVKLDDKKKSGKVSRWQAIAESAAKQSKRNCIPAVNEVLSFEQMLSDVQNLDLFLVPFENAEGMKPTKEALSYIKSGMEIGILIGPEGGFNEREIEKTEAVGGKTISLGSRILRTETAAITAVSMCMLHTEMNVE